MRSAWSGPITDDTATGESWASYRKISWSLEAAIFGLYFSHRSEIWQAPPKQRYQDTFKLQSYTIVITSNLRLRYIACLCLLLDHTVAVCGPRHALSQYLNIANNAINIFTAVRVSTDNFEQWLNCKGKNETRFRDNMSVSQRAIPCRRLNCGEKIKHHWEHR